MILFMGYSVQVFLFFFVAIASAKSESQRSKDDSSNQMKDQYAK
jgi:hypothetical protein